MEKALTTFSKDLNYTFGDRSGRTVTTRTGDGAYKLFGTDLSSHGVHIAMGATVLALSSDNPTANKVGVVVGVGLFLSYLAGK